MSVPPDEPLRARPPAVPPNPATPPAPLGTPPPARPRIVIESGRFWAGVLATALVAALIGVVGVVVFQGVLDVDLVPKDPFGTGSDAAAFAVGAVAGAVVAGLLLQVLALTTPRPRAFFGWIVALATIVVALLPLTWTDDTGSALATGLVNLLIGIAIGSLLSGVLARTSQRVLV